MEKKHRLPKHLAGLQIQEIDLGRNIAEPAQMQTVILFHSLALTRTAPTSNTVVKMQSYYNINGTTQ